MGKKRWHRVAVANSDNNLKEMAARFATSKETALTPDSKRLGN